MVRLYQRPTGELLSPVDIFDDYEAVGGHLDQDVLGLAAIGILAQCGWTLTFGAMREHVAWWIGRVSSALDNLGDLEGGVTP